MPELPGDGGLAPRSSTSPCRAFPIVKAGPAHIATLKTFDPPLTALEGRRLAGAERRAKRLLFPTEDGELVVLVHLMTAGRLKLPSFGEKGPKTPAFRLASRAARELVLTEAGLEEARRRLAADARRRPRRSSRTSGPEALGLGAERSARSSRGESRRLHSLLRDQRVIAGIGRAWANEILHSRAALAVRALTRPRRRGGRAARGGDRRELARGLALRERGANDTRTYRVHDKLGEPCHVCGTPIARVDYEEHTIYYCPGVRPADASSRTGGCRGC